MRYHQGHLLHTRGGLRAFIFVACHGRVWCGSGPSGGAGCGGACDSFSFSLGWGRDGGAEETKRKRRLMQGGGTDDLERLETYGTLV